jgi:hypothetical protein
VSEDPVPGWYADPTGRFEHRYWDGGAWTEHVARQGRATTDALDGSTVHTASARETQPIVEQHTGGTAADPSAVAWRPDGPARRTNTKAVLSLVLSLVWLFGLGSVAAIVLGVMARREIRERPDESGSGIATAGIVIGVLGILGMLLAVLAFLAFFTFGAGTSGSMFA